VSFRCRYTDYTVNSKDVTLNNTLTLLFIILISSKDTGLISDTLYVVFHCNSLSIQTLKMFRTRAADMIEVYTHTVLQMLPTEKNSLTL
jgi:hypothetical protein